MDTLAIVLLAIMLVAVLFAKGIRISIIVIFNGIWFVMCLLRKLNLCNYYDIDTKAYWIVVLGVFMFDVGYFAMHKNQSHQHQSETILYQYDSSMINQPLLFIVMIVHTVINTIYALRMIPYILSGYSLGNIRAIFQGYDDSANFYTGQGMHRAWSYFVSPWVTVLTCVIIYTLLSKKRLKPSFYLLYLVDMVAYLLYTASRATVFNVMVFAFVYFIVFFDNIDKSTRRKVYLGIAIILLIVLLLTSMSFANRSVSIYSAYRGLGSLYVYASGPISLLDEFVKEAEKNNYHTYGAVFVYPIIRIINAFRIVLGMGKSDICVYVEKILEQKEIFRFIAPGVYFNAYGTIFYEFYLDFRWLGIVIGCLLYGGMSQRVEEHWFKDRVSDRLMIFGGVFSLSFVYSIVRWHFSFMPYVLCFLYVLFICNNIKFTIGGKKL